MVFGEKIKAKFTALPSPDSQMNYEIPGTFPYDAAGARPKADSPVIMEDTCTLCGTCTCVCPTTVTLVGEAVTTEIEIYIRCCACIKNCPEGA